MERDDWKTWDKVLLRNKQLLPDYSGIYIVTDQKEFVLYVGKSKNIKNRWLGHHRHKQLINRDRKNRRFYLYFHHFSEDKLDEEEKYYINLLYPSLNSTKVNKYIPKIPVAESVLKKLLRTINKKTSLFPDIRSLVLGYWYSSQLNDSYCHIVIAVGINDLERPVVNSACVKSRNKWIRGTLKKKSNWKYYETDCGLSKDEYHPALVLTYFLQQSAIHFVWIGWEIIDWSRNNLEKLSKINLFGVETYCLQNPHILETVKLENYHRIINGKKRLYDSDFILSVLPSMQNATHYNFEITKEERSHF